MTPLKQSLHQVNTAAYIIATTRRLFAVPDLLPPQQCSIRNLLLLTFVEVLNVLQEHLNKINCL